MLGLGQMVTKGFSFSGEKPTEAVRNEDDTMGLVGLRWATEHDVISFEPKPTSVR